MRGIISAAGHVPHHRLRLERITETLGGVPARGTRAVASHDEDATTMAVAAARLALAAARAGDEVGLVAPSVVTFASATPPYLDKTNATAIHAALRLPRDVRAVDAGGAPRSAMGALLSALEGDRATLLTAADVRTGPPGGPDERETGDAGAAILVGSDGDGDVLAEVLGTSSLSEEFLDRYRPEGAAHTIRWEERFGETRYVPLAVEAFATALKDASLAADGVDRLIVTGLHARAVDKAAVKLAAGRDILVDDRTRAIGNSGTPHPLLLLADVLETATPDQTIALVVLADGADVLLLRTTDAISRWQPTPTITGQIAAGDDRLPYARFLTWRGNIVPELPRRPAPARASAPASSRNVDWKFGLTASRDRSTGALHLPPARVSWDGGAVDDMEPVPMADVKATIRTFTVDHLAWSPSPPTVFAVLDFDGGGRYACALTDCDAGRVKIGDRVELVFRKVGEADGVINYFWKARPLPLSSVPTDVDGVMHREG